MRISLFIPCFNDALFPGTGIATVHILERLGHTVSFPPDQTCCGQIHFNTGYWTEARRLMERFVRIFGDAEAVVAPSASCVAMVREQYPRLADETGGEAGAAAATPEARSSRSGSPPLAEAEDLAASVRSVASRTFELSEFLVGVLGVEDVGAVFPHRVALHPTCHSIRGIDVGDAPLRLLRRVRGLELMELPNARECCGFGGTFSVKNSHTSMAMLQDKLRDVAESGAEVLTAVDNSCLMHLAGGLHRLGRLEGPGEPVDRRRSGAAAGPLPPGSAGKVRVLHLAEILAGGSEVGAS